MSEKTIKIATDFSKYPGGRYYSDGPFSGEKFRDEFLIPVLREKDKVIIDLDGARGYGSSFLEEAFGGAVRAGFPPELINELIELRSSDQSLLNEIKEYIENGVISGT